MLLHFYTDTQMLISQCHIANKYIVKSEPSLSSEFEHLILTQYSYLSSKMTERDYHSEILNEECILVRRNKVDISVG